MCITRRSVAFVMHDVTSFMCGRSNLFKKVEPYSVGPSAVETMGLTVSGYFCRLGRKYIVCVSTLLGSASCVYWWGAMTPSFYI